MPARTDIDFGYDLRFGSSLLAARRRENERQAELRDFQHRAFRAQQLARRLHPLYLRRAA